MKMETLTELALERCTSARCAIRTMGDFASRYGFYGPGWDGSNELALSESGEAIVVSDPQETWMFHVLPDDTAASAVWVAQRVPDDHITAVANQFVIGEIDLSKPDFFMASNNVLDVAVRNHLWSPDTAHTVPFHFTKAYAGDLHRRGFAITRRVWRVFTLAAPSLGAILSPYTDGFGTFGYGADGSQPYPFSVKPDKPLSVVDIMTMNRDQYEGTAFDLTAGPGAGPMGDPQLFPFAKKTADPVNGITPIEANAGLGFERAISIWRTAYSTVTQSRASLPDSIGAVTWIAPYAPHFSSFVPVYASAAAPSSLDVGTPYKVDKNANWWAHCVTGNYLSRWYRHTIADVKAFQRKLEEEMTAAQAAAELTALNALRRARPEPGTETPGSAIATMSTTTTTTAEQECVAGLLAFHEATAASVRDQWWEFFFEMAGRYRDILKITNPHAPNFSDAITQLSVPRWWGEQIGFWGAPGSPPPGDEHSPVRVLTVPSEESRGDYAMRYPEPQGVNLVYEWHSPQEFVALQAENAAYQRNIASLSVWVVGAMFLGLAAGGAIAAVYYKSFAKSGHTYQPIV